MPHSLVGLFARLFHSPGLPLDKKTGTPKPIFGWSAPPCVILVYLFF